MWGHSGAQDEELSPVPELYLNFNFYFSTATYSCDYIANTTSFRNLHLFHIASPAAFYTYCSYLHGRVVPPGGYVELYSYRWTCMFKELFTKEDVDCILFFPSCMCLTHRAAVILSLNFSSNIFQSLWPCTGEVAEFWSVDHRTSWAWKWGKQATLLYSYKSHPVPGLENELIISFRVASRSPFTTILFYYVKNIILINWILT